MRPLNWYEMPDGSFAAHAFGGLLAYNIREMRDGRWAIMIGSQHESAKDSLAKAMLHCETDRYDRVKHEMS